MKVNIKIVSVIVVVLALTLLTVVPIYSRQVEGCKSEPASVRKSLLFGDTKEKVERAAQEFLDQSARYDCEINTVTYRLYIL